MSTQDNDPFGGYDLPEHLREAESDTQQSKKPSEAADQAQKEPRKANWVPSAFETQRDRGPARCEDCFHYVRGGALAIDQIYEVKDSRRGFELIDECKKFEQKFEFRELQQIKEKSMTLDQSFDEPPRIRGYCAANQFSRRGSYLIPEIKNHDGHCPDFRAGRRPWVDCDKCNHQRKAYKQRPSAADYQVSLPDSPALHDPDFAIDVGMIRGMYQRGESNYKRAEDEYEQNLLDDVREGIFYDRSPSNGTIDECTEHSYKACAVVNRSHHCPQFKAKTAADGRPGAKTPQNDVDRWIELQARDKDYKEEVQRVEAAQRRALDESLKKGLNLPPDRRSLPCFGCAHMRYPVNVDPFAAVHFNNNEIMELRDAYKRERTQRAVEERRICAQPGNALGDYEVPSLHIWCDKHSRKSADGRIQEYAYCYRVLKALAPDGNCPSFLSEEVASREREKKLEEERRAERDALDKMSKSGRSDRTLKSGRADRLNLLTMDLPDLSEILSGKSRKKDDCGITLTKPREKDDCESTLATPRESGPACIHCNRSTNLSVQNGRMWCSLCGDWAGPSGSVLQCAHCRRSTQLTQHNGRTWCGWCGDWAAIL